MVVHPLPLVHAPIVHGSPSSQCFGRDTQPSAATTCAAKPCMTPLSGFFHVAAFFQVPATARKMRTRPSYLRVLPLTVSRVLQTTASPLMPIRLTPNRLTASDQPVGTPSVALTRACSCQLPATERRYSCTPMPRLANTDDRGWSRTASRFPRNATALPYM